MKVLVEQALVEMGTLCAAVNMGDKDTHNDGSR